MIKFFRKIRQQLLSQNRFSKYMLYAVGEIILVVIGILIALKVNNRNININNIQKVEIYLKDMVSDLEKDTLLFNRAIRLMKRDISNNRLLIQTTDYQAYSLDSLFQLVDSYYYDYRITDESYKRINNMGLTEYLESIEVYDSISEYYNVQSNRYDIFIEYDKEFSLQNYRFWYYNYEFEIGLPEDENIFLEDTVNRKQGLIRMLSTTKGRNLIRNDIDRKLNVITVVEKTKAKATELIKLIKKELEG